MKPTLDPILAARLDPVRRRERRIRYACALALAWLAASLAGWGGYRLAVVAGWGSAWVWPNAAALGLVLTLLGWFWVRRRPVGWKTAARMVERRFPELEGRLLAATDFPLPPERETPFIPRRLLDETLDHSHRQSWPRAVPLSRLLAAQLAGGLSVALFLWLALGLPRLKPADRSEQLPYGEVQLTPGDVEMERGSALVVLARFGPPVPEAVELVAREADGTERRLSLTRALEDPMFGGTLAEVNRDLTYWLEYGDWRTRSYQVRVFERPRLVRSDIRLIYPAYTSLQPRLVEETRRATAVEGTRVEVRLRFNLPVARAEFLPIDGGEPIRLSQPDAAALEAFWTNHLQHNAQFRLVLTDSAGRTNQEPPLFAFVALTNRPPELRLTFPRGDLRPSPIEEIEFRGTVRDDFGVEAHGLGWRLPDGSTRRITLGEHLPGGEVHPFTHLLRLEEWALAPQQLLTWFAWADDRGPDGALRRTYSDLWFAEIRPFDEVFRRAANAASSSSSQPNEGQPGNQSGRLAEIQKQIITATWRLLRETTTAAGQGPDDRYRQHAGVVRDSQQAALEQAGEAAAQSGDPGQQVFWEETLRRMQLALENLTAALDSPEPLPQALESEQAAYQALLRLQEREYEVARRRQAGRSQRSQSSRQQLMQRQLQQLDLTDQADRYETERLAREPLTPERREQTEILNRLRELARRQEDINQQLRELQTALQSAEPEAERDELRRRLQRLQEAERRMLADLDRLQQRMQQARQSSQWADPQQRLQQARENLRRAAEAAAQGAASQALAAGARAQEQMEQAREDLRRQSASAFAADLRQMRRDIRHIAQRQAELGRRLEALDAPANRSLREDNQRERLQQELAGQQQQLTNLLAHVREVSDLAEGPEPLLARSLYDTLRNYVQQERTHSREFREDLLARGLLTRDLYERLLQAERGDQPVSVPLTAEMLERGLTAHAREAARRARAGIDTLRQGIEAAAEKVLGDDTQSLQLARSELDRLARELEQELAAQATNRAAVASATTPSSTNNLQRLMRRLRTGGAGQTNRLEDEPIARGEGRPDAGSTNRADLARTDDDDARSPGPSGIRSEPAAVASQAQAESQGAGQAGTDRSASLATTPAQPNPIGTARTAEALRRALSEAARANRSGGFREEPLDWLAEGRGGYGTGPLTGPDFAPWWDRLRDVEEMIDWPDWRARLARAHERAADLRRAFREERRKPDWAVVRTDVLGPLVEVRDAVTEELSRRRPENQLAPVDRDPVPPPYAELVQRYYERLAVGFRPNNQTEDSR